MSAFRVCAVATIFASTVAETANSQAPIQPESTVQYTITTNNKDDDGGRVLSTDGDALVDLYKGVDGRTERQLWTFEATGSQGLYNIRQVRTQKFLSTDGGAKVDLFHTDDKSGRQRWRLVGLRNGTFNIMFGSKFLSTDGDKKVDLFNRDDNSGRQQWKLVAYNKNPTKPNIGKPIGKWVRGCGGGQSCKATIARSLDLGSMSEKSWSAEVRSSLSVAVEAGVEVPGASATTTVTSTLEAAYGEAASIARSKNQGFSESCEQDFDFKSYDIYRVWQWQVQTPVNGHAITIKTCTVTCTSDDAQPKYVPGDRKALGACLKKR